MKIGKYEFKSEEHAQKKIDKLGLDEDGNPTHPHTVVKIGYLTITQGEYDEDGNEITPPVLSDKYSVDVLWQGVEDNPYGWATYELDLEHEGIHGFFGRKYTEHKI